MLLLVALAHAAGAYTLAHWSDERPVEITPPIVVSLIMEAPVQAEQASAPAPMIEQPEPPAPAPAPPVPVERPEPPKPVDMPKPVEKPKPVERPKPVEKPRPEPKPAPKPEPRPEPKPAPEAVQPTPQASASPTTETAAAPTTPHVPATAQADTRSAPQRAAQTGPTTAPRHDADYLNNPKPSYPALSQRMREEGTVKLRVFVSAEGRAEKIELSESSGFRRLDEAAEKAVARWRFVPARQGAQNISAWYIVPITFKLQG